jgi:hypothetical protein
MPDGPAASRLERALIALEILLAVGAYGGGFGLISSHWNPGAFLSTAELQGTPFSSWLIPGVLLVLLNGVLPTAVAIGAMAAAPWARRGHALVGLVLTCWIVVQVAMIGYGHPLQAVYLAWGIVMLVLGLMLLRTEPPGQGRAPRG